MLLSSHTTVHAHLHHTDEQATITTQLHIDPGDNPIIGEQAVIHYKIFSQEYIFTHSDCTCTSSIYLNNNLLFSTSEFITTESTNSFSHYYTFPQAGVYTISIQGQIENQLHSHNFHNTFDIRVDQEPTPQQPTTSYLGHFLVYSPLILLLIPILLILSKKNPSHLHFYHRLPTTHSSTPTIPPQQPPSRPTPKPTHL